MYLIFKSINMEEENKQTISANDCCEGACSNCGPCSECCTLLFTTVVFGWLYIWNSCGCNKCCSKKDA